VREKRKENPRLVEKESGIDYRFHTTFQQDFYETVIIPKNKPVVISRWIEWNYMEGKSDRIFDEVMTACRAKHLRDIMAFRKNWNNEIIAQLFATLYIEERGDTRRFHWMTEGRWYVITYENFARLFGFGRKDSNRHKIHHAIRLDTSKMRFMYPSNKRGSVGTTLNLLPFYDFYVFDFIWEEIKTISESSLKSCGYAPFIMHMIKRVTSQTFGCDKEHHPLWIKNDLRAPWRI
jgi:hypothetical protein